MKLISNEIFWKMALSVPVTGLFAGVFGSMFVVLSFQVIKLRRSLRVSLGDGSRQMKKEIDAGMDGKHCTSKLQILSILRTYLH